MKHHSFDSVFRTGPRGQQILMFFIVLCAIALRIYVAISRTDNHWADEQFQTLEPASFVVFHHGYLSWEWLDGYRSWFIPGLYMPLFFILKQIGISGGDTVIHLSRLFTALISCLMIFRINTIFRILYISFWSRAIALSFFAFSPGMILYACSTLADNWAMIILWFILPEILLKIDSKNKMDWFFMGVLAGLTVLAKYQMMVWVLGLGLTCLMIQVPVLLCIAAMAGCALVLTLSGVLDWVTWGQPFHSLIQHISRGYEISQSYESLPWWDYFPKIIEDTGFYLFVPILICMGLSLSKWQSSLAFFTPIAKKLAVIFIPCFIFILFHMLMGHKENRFLLPIYPCFFCLLGILLETTLIPSFLAKHIKIWVVLIILLPCQAFFSLNAIAKTSLILTPVDIADLETVIYNDHGLSPQGDSCILLFDYSWAFTHGELILGQKATYVESSIDKVLKSQLQACRYAIVSSMASKDFKAKAGQAWKMLKSDNRNYMLYKNASFSPWGEGVTK